MNEDENLRVHYLELMGISVWQQSLVTPFIEVEPSVQDLQTRVMTCSQCQLATTRQQVIWGEGNLHADWFIVFDFPTAHEDEQGKILVGNEGLLIDEILRTLKLSRDAVFMTHLVKCLPFSALPTGDEMSKCYEHLQQQIVLVQPKLLFVLGELAAQTLLKSTDSLTQLRGKVYDYSNIPVIVSFSPTHLLSDCLAKRAVWNDLQLALKTLSKKE